MIPAHVPMSGPPPALVRPGEQLPYLSSSASVLSPFTMSSTMMLHSPLLRRTYSAELALPLTNKDTLEREFKGLIDKIRNGPSELRAARNTLASCPSNVLHMTLRELTTQDTYILEQNNVRCQDWSQVRVARNFDPFRCRNVQLYGRCVLGVFKEEIEVQRGLRLPSGIYNSTLVNCQVGDNCLIEGVRFAANIIFEGSNVVIDVGSITCSSPEPEEARDLRHHIGGATFGCGQRIPVALESGGRELDTWAEMMVEDAALVVRERGSQDDQQKVTETVQDYCRSISSYMAWVRKGARVSHTVEIRDAYIGYGAVIETAKSVINCCVLSEPTEQTSVVEGSTVHNSILQWGVRVGGGATVKSSVLLEHCATDENAIVTNSVICPNTQICKGECTASLVGPFVGFHHQSLLISAFWPEGKGNIAYGGMLGSNHTGRAPDQEIRPGEGNFFGLGCSIRFPADYSRSPYTLIAAGVRTLPQKVCFPFSLLQTPDGVIEGIPPAFNELLPGWGLIHNSYGLARTEMKFEKRDTATRHRFEYKVLRPAIIQMVIDALTELQSIASVKAVYTETDIKGLGKNFLREQSRLEGIEAYHLVLKRYALRIALGRAEGVLTIPESDKMCDVLLDLILPGSSFDDQMNELLKIEKENAEKVLKSKAADDERGKRIIPGYEHAHAPAANDAVVKAAQERFQKTLARIKKLHRKAERANSQLTHPSGSATAGGAGEEGEQRQNGGEELQVGVPVVDSMELAESPAVNQRLSLKAVSISDLRHVPSTVPPNV